MSSSASGRQIVIQKDAPQQEDELQRIRAAAFRDSALTGAAQGWHTAPLLIRPRSEFYRPDARQLQWDMAPGQRSPLGSYPLRRGLSCTPEGTQGSILPSPGSVIARYRLTLCPYGAAQAPAPPAAGSSENAVRNNHQMPGRAANTQGVRADNEFWNLKIQRQGTLPQSQASGSASRIPRGS